MYFLHQINLIMVSINLERLPICINIFYLNAVLLLLMKEVVYKCSVQIQLSKFGQNHLNSTFI